LATMGSVAGSLQHCFRERETDNADADKTQQNEHKAASTTDEAMGKLRDLLPEKRRKDAVLAIEYVMTASPEWWQQATLEQQQVFFQRSRQWLADKYGSGNVIVETIHRDEISPHLSAFVVPLTKDGRLSAREFIGGRNKMTNDQTCYAASLADLGLSRGIEGSKTKHRTIKDFYSHLAGPLQKPEIKIPEPGLSDRLKPAEYGQRVSEVVLSQVMPEIETAAATRLDFDLNKKAILSRQKTLEAAEKELKESKALVERLKQEAANNLKKAEMTLLEAERLENKNKERLESLADLPKKHNDLVNAYNQNADKYNNLIADHKELIKKYKDIKEDSNTMAASYNNQLRAALTEQAKENRAKAEQIKNEMQAAHEAAMQDLKNKLQETRSRLDGLAPQLELADRLQAVCDANRVWPETILEKLEANQDEVVRLRDLDDSPGYGY